jgi:decaprenylphospho-beta-D-ribofuranose 2-oxidase
MAFVANWNNYPTVEAEMFDITDSKQNKEFAIRGNGRCYGDASLFSKIGSTLGLDKVLSFDPKEGVIKCQAGLLLSDILDVIIPAGWFLPVTPGTKFITIGGAIASDVHGKNHHSEGSISAFTKQLSMLTGIDDCTICSPNFNQDLFWATCGGMGLTGIILDVTLQLKKIEGPFIRNVEIKARDLSEILTLFDSLNSWTYSVAWIDCLSNGKNTGRSIFMAGEHSIEKAPAKLNAVKKPLVSVPFFFPSFILNPTSATIFNSFFYALKKGSGREKIVHYDNFFYPLDFVFHWNKIYSKRGFIQYQFVLPMEAGKEGLHKILSRINASGFGVYLAVLKLFGSETGIISFPMKGYTLALDLPIKKGLFKFLDELDRMVADYGGRIYLSKDARMSKEIFWSTYPNAASFQELLLKYDPQNRFVSLLSQRLALKD